MNYNIAGCLLLLAFACHITDAKAALGLELSPGSPASGQPTFARVVSDAGPRCLPAIPVIMIAGQDIYFKLVVTDSCEPEDVVEERTYSIGTFSQGAYVLHGEYCVDNPMPFPDDCETFGSVPFQVRGAAGPASVPVASWYAILALFAGIVGFAAATMRSEWSLK